MKIQTVKLELLRPGPPHNQLLSPLTEYIALCGDAPPETVRVPFEHYRILRQLQGLRPGRPPAEVDGALTELREDVVRLLSGIRCLATSLAQAHGDGAEVIELELVLSASELSLIPFELAFVPGSPTRELAHREVIVMRRSRRVPRARLRWQRRPRVLLVAASPPGFRPVPVQQHVQGIREALAPWLAYLDGHDDAQANLPELNKFLVVLPNASELSLQEAIRAAVYQGHPFTHVHVLAHGDEIGANDQDFAEQGVLREPRFGLALHDSRVPNKGDTLTGRRFFSALAGSDERCQRQLPQVVTLASCDSGNIGGVVVPGASVAHEVHDGGVPLVVAAQFPLTYHGSNVFVRRLYERLLAGDDPRCALRETRRSVHAAGTRDLGPVDWGAIVQYGALPSDLEKHVHDAQVRALRQRADAALSSVDPHVKPEGKGTLLSAWKQAAEALVLLESLKADPGVDRYIARTHLRWAFILKSKKDDPQLKELDAQANLGSNLNISHALPVSDEHCLRIFRDGLRRHYRVTHNPVSLVESILGDFFLHEPIDAKHAITGFTACLEAHQAAPSGDVRRKLERAVIELWVIAKDVPDLDARWADVHKDLVGVGVLWNRANWFEVLLDRQFADAPATDYEYFASRRQVRRIITAAEEPGNPEPDTTPSQLNPDTMDPPEPETGDHADLGPETPPSPQQTTLERAQLVDAFFQKRRVPKIFSAIVDWIEQPDGGRRTVAM